MPGKKYRTEEMLTEERIEKLRAVLEKRTDTLTVVMENINDPHNMSAVLRTCDAVGVLDVRFVYYGTQPFPKLGKHSSGSAKKWIKKIRYDNIKDCYADLRKEGKKIYTTHMAKDSVSLYKLDLKQPVALVFGNEHDGVSEEAHKQADGNFLIPQVGMAQSLNISVAAAISLFEAFRQRLEAGMYDKPQLSPEKLEAMYKKWVNK